MRKTACIVEGAAASYLLHGHILFVQQQTGRLLHLNRKNEVFRRGSIRGKEPSAECLGTHIHLRRNAFHRYVARYKALIYYHFSILKESILFYLLLLRVAPARIQQPDHSSQPLVFFLEYSELFLMHSFRPAQHPPCTRKHN